MIERYARKKLRNLWSDKTRFQHMLDVELATTFAFSQIGIVPKEDYENHHLREVHRGRLRTSYRRS